MRLFALLNWYDESPTWLATTITSLTNIGVDHVIAVDGAYYLYPHARARSGAEQAEAVHFACDSVGIGLTMERPQDGWLRSEAEKRTHLFRLAMAIGTTGEDWLFAIDADEVVTDRANIKPELEAAGGVDVFKAHIWETMDPYAEPGIKNVHQKTAEMYQKLDLDHRFGYLQTRFFRLMSNMRCDTTHYTYIGERDGVAYSLRGDKQGREMGYQDAVIGTPETIVDIEHRDPLRTKRRVGAKKEYYQIRDAAGIEKVTTTSVVGGGS
jgi:hypothetical protein